MANSLFPGFVRINYHSGFGPHTMTIPTLPWDASGGAPASGEFDAWDASVIEADVMINALADLLLPFFPNTVTLDDYIIYTMASPTADPQPQYSAGLSLVGSSVSPGWAKATQVTWSFRTNIFGASKLVMLDAATNDLWDKVTDISGVAPALALVAEYTALTNGWSGRDGARPSQFAQIAYTLNEKLRRSYRMN